VLVVILNSYLKSYCTKALKYIDFAHNLQSTFIMYITFEAH